MQFIARTLTRAADKCEPVSSMDLICSKPGAWQHCYVSRIVGIDLGTTNSLVATVDAGIPLVIADAVGQRLTPSVVHVPGPNADPVIGHKANRVRVLKPAETVYS